MSTIPRLAGLISLCAMLVGCQQSPTPLSPPLATDPPVAALARQETAEGMTLLAGFHLQIDPAALTASVTPHRSGQAQPPQGQRYDLDIANFQNADSFRVTGVQVLGSGNFRVTFSHAHPFPAPNVANPVSGTNRADLGYSGRLLILTGYNPKSYFSGAVRLSAGAVVGPDGYVETGDLLAHAGPALVTAYPYKLLADEAQDNRTGVSNGGSPIGSYVAGSGGWQRNNLGAAGTGWTGYDYLHGGQSITNQFTLSKEVLTASNFALDVALLIQYTDPRGSGGSTHRLPAETASVTNFAYRLPYAALDVSRVIPTANLTLQPVVGSSATLEVRVRDWDAGAAEAPGKQVGTQANVALIQQGGSGAPEVVLDCPDLLNAGLRNMGTPASGTGLSNAVFVYSNSLPNQTGASPGTYYGCLRVTDVEFADSERGSWHAGVDATTLVPSASRAVPARTWQIVPVTVSAPPVITSVTPTGLIGAVDDPITFRATASGNVTSWSWDFGGGTRTPGATGQEPTVFLAGTAGTFQGNVTATGPEGTSAPYPFSFRVLPPVKPVLKTHKVFPATVMSGYGPTGDQVVIIDNRPILLFVEYDTVGSTYVRCAVAQDSDPESTLDWNLYTLEAVTSTSIAAAVIDGKPACVFNASSGGFQVPHYAYSFAPHPARNEDWIINPMQSPTNGFGGDLHLVNYNDTPYACTRDSANVLVAYMTSSTTPSGPASWTSHQITSSVDSFDLLVLPLPEGPRIMLATAKNGPGLTQLYAANTNQPVGSASYESFIIFTGGSRRVSMAGGLVHPDYSHVLVVRIGFEASPLPYLREGRMESAASYSVVSNYQFPDPAIALSGYGVELLNHNDRLALFVNLDTDKPRIYRALSPTPLPTDWESASIPVEAMTRATLVSHDNRLSLFGRSQFDGHNFWVQADGPW
ncbi:MAG: hypothetical protein GEEBNDBF_02214 [bacterium]|nr:hypothetical protein [bacterium]